MSKDFKKVLKILLPICLLLILANFIVKYYSFENKVERDYSKAQKYLKENNIDLAIVHFKEVCAYNHKDSCDNLDKLREKKEKEFLKQAF
ncbi:MAG: hypothetical protein ACK5LP_02450 [Campylobacteraceae bacterium]